MVLKLRSALERGQQRLETLLVDWGDVPKEEQMQAALQLFGASEFKHAHGRTLGQHLLATREILKAWSQPFWIQAAGCFHSVYSTDIYKPQLLDIAQRDRLRAIIGSRAERLVFLFCQVNRYVFFEKVFEPPHPDSQGLVVSGPEAAELELSSSEVFGLLVLHMANEAEQSCMTDGRPGIWLARVSALGNQAREAGGPAPPPFDNCTRLFSSDDELLLRESYEAAFAAVSSDRAAAKKSFAKCSQLCPWLGEPAILEAYLDILDGNGVEAQSAAVQAARIITQWGTAWDKRLSPEQWKLIAEILANDRNAENIRGIAPEFIHEPRSFYHRVISCDRPTATKVARQSPRPFVAPAQTPKPNSGLTRLETYINSFAERDADPRKPVYPDLPSQPWYDSSDFPIVHALESAFPRIRKEILNLPQADFHHESEKIRRKGAWNVLFFYERGRQNADNCSRCPTIAAIIEQYETMRTQAGLIYASRMLPGTHIAAHRGPTNLRVRCHLGIQVPEGDCGLRVNQEIGSWSEGRCIVFDDYYEHEAWNYTEGERIVLIVDLWHPGLTPHEREVLKNLHRYASAHAETLHRYWDANLKAKNQGLLEYH